LTPGRARRRRLLGTSLIALLALLSGALALGRPSAAPADKAQAAALTARTVASAAAPARPGTNLLRNPDGTVGDTSAQGWDAVTIPGWLGGTATRVGYSPDAIAVSGTNAYVANTIDGTVTPVNIRTGQAARPLNVGAYTYPTAITVTGHTAVVLEPYGYAVVVINLTTGHVYAPITVGGYPTAVAITA